MRFIPSQQRNKSPDYCNFIFKDLELFDNWRRNIAPKPKQEDRISWIYRPRSDTVWPEYRTITFKGVQADEPIDNIIEDSEFFCET